MKREILFRGKRIDNGEWVYGYYYHQIVRDSFNSENPILFEKDFIRPIETIGIFESYEVIPETIGQFTGASDAEINGREVFDGDIIQNCDTRRLQEVYYDEDRFAWYCRYLYDKQQIVSLRESLGNLNKVLGNIHDNPELLK